MALSDQRRPWPCPTRGRLRSLCFRGRLPRKQPMAFGSRGRLPGLSRLPSRPPERRLPAPPAERSLPAPPAERRLPAPPAERCLPAPASFPARTRSSPVSPGSQGRVRWQFYSFSSYRILATRHAPGPKAESVCSLGSTLSGGGGAVVRVSPARVSPYSPTRLPHPSESVRVGPCLELTGRSKPCQRRLRPLHTRARVRADSAAAATERLSDMR